MSDEILINASEKEIRLAYLVNQTLQEFHIERLNQQSLLGNIYQAKVKRIVDKMQAVFVDIGLERTAYLPFKDIQGPNLLEGQMITVQVYKDAVGTKGPKVTMRIIPGSDQSELRVLKYWLSPKVKKIRVDNKKILEKLQQISNLKGLLEYYSEKMPLFTHYGLDAEIQSLLKREVLLKSGAYLIIDQTEAMVTVDVNTGSFLGEVMDANLEAIPVIARQIRLRNLAGIIVIDFIDTVDLDQRAALLQTFTAEMLKDPLKVQISELSSLGLIQMTRRRVRKSLEAVLCEPCPCCQKRGSVKTIETVTYEIFNKIRQIDAETPWSGYLIQASADVIEELGTLSEFLGKPIKLHAEESYGREQYGILPL